MHWIALQALPEPVGLAEGEVANTLVGLPDPVAALGWWALQYTPKVALLGDVVLLEVSASERLWGGRAALLRHIYTSNKPVALVKYARGTTSLIAIGRLLAGQSVHTEPDQLPLAVLLAARPHVDTLARLGCSCWGQLRALPRGGVTRRFGADLLDALDQAYGDKPDVYPWLLLPDVFDARLVLPAQVENASALLFGARRLLAQLEVWLQARHQGVLAIGLVWYMDVRRNTATQGALHIRTAEPTADMSHLQRLLGEHLTHVSLPAPAEGLRLRSLQTQALAGHSASLLPDEQLPGDSLAQTLERLSARLGADKVLQLQAHADHRPEWMQSWVATEKAIKSIATRSCKSRAEGEKVLKNLKNDPLGHPHWRSALHPTWLLAEPLKLAVHQQQPYYQGPLRLLAGPQRLESGWWQGLALRDYFVAQNPNATLLWIYRERLGADNTQWYLHGLFS